MTNIGEIFGFPGEQNPTPFDASNMDSEIDRIMATRPIPGAPPGYQSPHPSAPRRDGDPGVVGGGQEPMAPVAPGAPAVPPPFEWPQGPSAPLPPAAQQPQAPTVDPAAQPLPQPGQPAAGPADPFAGLSDLERFEALQVIQALRDPDRAAGVRRAYIGAPEPIGGAPTGPPPLAPPVAAAPAALPAPPQLPDNIEEGTAEAAMFYRQAETDRQLAEIRQMVTTSNAQTEAQLNKSAADAASAKFVQRYSGVLTPEEITWVHQSAGYQKLPEAFMSADPRLSREDAMTQALEFKLRSTDQLFTKIVGGQQAAPAIAPPVAPPAQPPAPPAPVVYPGQTPQADARHRYLTALSSAASPSGEAPSGQPLTSRPDGRLDERSRTELVRQMMSGGAMGELMGPQ